MSGARERDGAGERDQERAAAVAAVERAMVAIRRGQSRRTLGRLAAGSPAAAPAAGESRPVDPTLLSVLDAVEARGDHPCTVTDVAAALGVDQPRASRLVLRATGEGWLTRAADPADARRALLTLTGHGREALETARRGRREVFDRIMDDWPDADRTAFARLLTAFVASYDRFVADSGR